MDQREAGRTPRSTTVTVLPTNNDFHGFFGTVALKKGADGAEKEWHRAFHAIASAAPNAKPEEVRNFLDSPYGRHVADEHLSGHTVEKQLEFRRARFLRHFAEIQRQTAAGKFDD